MCGQFYVEKDDLEEILRSIVVSDNKLKNIQTGDSVKLKSGVIFPTDVVPVIANSRKLIPSAYAMKWGFKHNSKSTLVINARSETALEKPLFSESAAKRRCLIPMTGYFEWEKREKAKIKYSIRPTESRHSYLGGLYRLDPASKLPVFVVLTRPVVENISFIHGRMPVILSEANAEEWLSPEGEYGELITKAVNEVEFERCNVYELTKNCSV